MEKCQFNLNQYQIDTDNFTEILIMGFFSKSKPKDSSSIKLLCLSGDAASYKCIFLASYRKLPIEIIWKNESELDDKISESLNMADLQRYPCIEDGDFTICGENAVFTFLNIKGQSPSIHPRKARVLAMQQYWIQILESKLSPMLNNFNNNNSEIETILNALDNELDNQSYIVGELSLADFHWLGVFKTQVERGSNMHESFTNITSWFSRMKKEVPDYDVNTEKVAA